MTPNEPQQIIADALDDAAERLRVGIVTGAEPERVADPPPAADPLSDFSERALKVEQVAQLLGVSAWSIYEAIKAGEMPAIHVGRRILVPTHALRGWMSDSASRHG
jgi:excisionase family DNA binding protein